jgi:hypothetical protein
LEVEEEGYCAHFLFPLVSVRGNGTDEVVVYKKGEIPLVMVEEPSSEVGRCVLDKEQKISQNA